MRVTVCRLQRRVRLMRLRKAPAVWTIASAAGRDVAVISYYATWPVEKVNGVMLSDRLELGLAGSIWPADSPLLENAEPSWANGSSEEVQVLRRRPAEGGDVLFGDHRVMDVNGLVIVFDD